MGSVALYSNDASSLADTHPQLLGSLSNSWGSVINNLEKLKTSLTPTHSKAKNFSLVASLP
jgi:hypothetical protein